MNSRTAVSRLGTSVLHAATLSLVLGGGLAAQGFGSSLTLGEAEVFVGEGLNTREPGFVYVFARDAQGAWARAHKVQASDAEPGDHFGRALTFADGSLLVGTTVRRNTTGAVYVLDRMADGSWRESGILTASDGVEGDALGRMMASDGRTVLAAAWAHQEGRGAVYVFAKDGSGNWRETGKLMGSDIGPEELFGMSLAVDGDWALVGAPNKNDNTGVVYAFHLEGGTWTEVARLTGAEAGPDSRFGTSLALQDGEALIGAQTHNQFRGAAFRFALDATTNQWRQIELLSPQESADPGFQYGAAVAYNGDDEWIGAPGANEFSGSAFVLSATGITQIAAPAGSGQSGFASTFEVRSDRAVIGLPGADFGLGSVSVYERGAQGWSLASAPLLGDEPAGVDAITGDQVDCGPDGRAAIFDCQEVDILSFLPVRSLGGARGVEVNDVWGWTDPDSGKEYALVGRYDGTSFVDISNPGAPLYLGDLPMHEGANGNVWRDIKVYANHAFIVSDGAGPHGMQVFDLTHLRNPSATPMQFTEDAHYDGIASAHNIVINEATGFAYAVGVNSGGETCGGGLHMIDIREPLRPTFVGCFQDMETGNQRTGYSHDAQCVSYHGPDVEHQGKEICFGSNETALSVADVTDKNAPIALSHASYPNVAYTHQGWLDDAQEYFYMNDEGDEASGLVDHTRTLVWDVKDLDDPILVNEYLGPSRSIDHNLYVVGDLMYQSNYVSGLRIVDISDRVNPREVAFFDTVPWSDDPIFDGSWSNYPFFQSGTLVVTSGKEGLFLLKKKDRPVS